MSSLCYDVSGQDTVNLRHRGSSSRADSSWMAILTERGAGNGALVEIMRTAHSKGELAIHESEGDLGILSDKGTLNSSRY